ncbi:alpha-amylase/4-alpha-glucanotransferase domain-containing protein [Hydrogenothermus marinus]|uniref:Uncharacterized protein DUF1925 n=1 Tax=Hydrogenothermus marinus TaxID=133270 RepID=A0A3M0BT62_9AQUI|nr:alpha-amylase/4-alpha-glucanotransferase domain-containing protein [Hydrogenothermus marinus]RMA97705.1 uncharacterized protein DUF1925 [Hydrogenothermus marinus]
MKTLLLFGVHMHQPVDNLKEAIDNAIEKCYAPFFEVLKDYPEFKFSLHCSGWLFEKIKYEYSTVFENIKYLINKGSIEIFGGGYYEPILSSIPKEDRINQLKKLNSFLKKEFNQEPKGIWLTERVWESGIISDLKETGFDYCMVDDYHFINVGFDEKDLNGYYLTEEGGEIIGLFPISKRLRYDIPFKEVDIAIKSIKSRKEVAIIFDDLEKFGLWPNTYGWVYEKGWLKQFIEKILENKEIIPIHYNEYFNQYKPKGLAYIPNVSYYEMGEWSLNTEEAIEIKKLKKQLGEDIAIKFLKSGLWKNFFVKYEESNRIHKRMLECSKNKLKDEKYLDYLYKSQCNDVLWHGVFGGLYLPNLRDNAYRYIIECENLRYKNKNIIEINDNDLDGFEEVKIITENLIARFYSKYGGQLIELDDRKSCFNFQNTLTRRKEAYHEELINNNQNKKDKKVVTIHEIHPTIDEKTKNEIVYDWYIKNSFIDHISDNSFNLENFKKCSFKELGDFTNQPFQLKKEGNTIKFKRIGGIYQDKTYPTTIEKRYITEKNKIDFNIKVDTESINKYLYILEFNFHFANLENIFINNKNSLNDLEINNIKQIEILDLYTKNKILISTDNSFSFYSTLIKTLSQNEKGVDFIIQGVSFALIFSLEKQLNINGSLSIENV